MIASIFLAVVVPLNYPTTPTDDVVDDFHGTPVADPYRWLEGDGPEVRAFIDEQNAITDAYLDVESKPAIRARLEELTDYLRFSTPSRYGDTVIYTRNDGLQPQSVMYVRGGGDVEGDRVLIDPNTFSDDGTVALAGTTFTKDGALMAYAVSVGGSDQRVVKVRQVESGEDLADELTNMRFSGIAWNPDNTGFWYNQYPSDESRLNNRLRYHVLGEPQGDGAIVYTEPDDPELSLFPFVTDAGDYLVVYKSRGTDRRSGVMYREICDDCDPAKQGGFTELFPVQDARYSIVGNTDSTFYVLTDKDAPRRKLVAVDLLKPEIENWQTIIPEGEAVLETVGTIDGGFVAVHSKDGRSVLTVRDRTGGSVRNVELPGEGTVFGVDTDPQRETFTFGYTSYNFPSVAFAADEELGLEEVFPSTLDFDPSGFDVSLHFATSKDGTQVPLFVTHKKGLELDGDNPAILYGYGGFSIGQSPYFAPSLIAWLEQGGVYIFAGLRGGDEYGAEWHEAGKLENKQNVFDDFIASAEWAIDNGYTKPEKLAIRGGSNGGLLVAAVELQRPDLFGAVICQVPVIDMLRYHTFGTGRFWTVEYGNAMENPEHFEFMYAYSPLHNVEEGVLYPPTLVLTADGDDRVVPAHAFKYVATLQANADPNGIYLLHHQTDAGHGAGKPTAKRLDEAADIYAFLVKQFGMTWE
ncbi:MAG: prolyl oligopeptidase family serine peptidase [Planctomycetota bacterium]